MSQFAFGTGSMWAAQTQDALGNVIANLTPIKFGEVQDTSIDISRDVKLLHGQLMMPVAVGGGKGKIDIKAKFARIMGKMWSDLFFGQTLSTGSLTGVVNDTTGSVIPATPFQISVTPPNSGLFSRDLGVVSSLGLPFTRVASAPATQQYAVAGGSAIGGSGTSATTTFTCTIAPTSGSYQVGSTLVGAGFAANTVITALGTGTGGTGTYTTSVSNTVGSATPVTGQPTYTFATADAASTVFISYTYSAASTNAKVITLTNLPMGFVPTFGLDMAIQFNGKQNNWRFPNCVAPKMTFDPKQDDFTQMDMDISVFADSAGNIGYVTSQE
jgi:hypothetical protein